MGLTLHWSIASRQRKLVNVRQRFNELWLEAHRLPFRTTEVRHIELNQMQSLWASNHWNASDVLRSGALGTAAYEASRPVYTMGRNYWRLPTHVFTFGVTTGDGCEDFILWLATYGDKLYDGANGQTIHVTASPAERGWLGTGFCKTVYAYSSKWGGLEHFLTCHLAIIYLFDAARRLHYRVDVEDEGSFETARDLRILAAQVAEHPWLSPEILASLRKKFLGFYGDGYAPELLPSAFKDAFAKPTPEPVAVAERSLRRIEIEAKQ